MREHHEIEFILLLPYTKFYTHSNQLFIWHAPWIHDSFARSLEISNWTFFYGKTSTVGVFIVNILHVIHLLEMFNVYTIRCTVHIVHNLHTKRGYNERYLWKSCAFRRCFTPTPYQLPLFWISITVSQSFYFGVNSKISLKSEIVFLRKRKS